MRKKMFVAKGEVIKFDGFLKVYLESTDDENGENGEREFYLIFQKVKKFLLLKLSPHRDILVHLQDSQKQVS